MENENKQKKNLFSKDVIVVVLTVVMVVVLSVAAVFVIGGKKKQDAQGNTSDEVTTSDTSESETETESGTSETETEMFTKNTTVQLTEKTEAVRVLSEYFSKSEIRNFQDEIGEIVYYGLYSYDNQSDKMTIKKYDCQSAGATQSAYNTFFGIGYLSLMNKLIDIYDLNSNILEEHRYYNDEGTETGYYLIDGQHVDRDPKGLFSYVPIFSFFSIKANTADEYISKTFNVTPDHSMKVDYGEGAIHMYYDNGKYYYDTFPGGEETCPRVEMKSAKPTANGKYQIIADFSEMYDEKVLSTCEIKVTAELKNVDGTKIWSFYTIESN